MKLDVNKQYSGFVIRQAAYIDEIQSEAYVMAVSYTHLRAHETRHDLVCRLLLEKKKRNKKTAKILRYNEIYIQSMYEV